MGRWWDTTHPPLPTRHYLRKPPKAKPAQIFKATAGWRAVTHGTRATCATPGGEVPLPAPACRSLLPMGGAALPCRGWGDLGGGDRRLPPAAWAVPRTQPPTCQHSETPYALVFNLSCLITTTPTRRTDFTSCTYRGALPIPGSATFCPLGI